MRNLKTDVAIISAGSSGIAAAIAAKENGVDVISLEKSSRTGGSAIMAGGIFAIESRLQKEKGVNLTKEEAFRMHMKFSHWKADAKLVRAYYDKSADTIEWLEKMGVEFENVVGHGPDTQMTCHAVKRAEGRKGKAGGAAANMIKIMTERAKRLGVKIYFKTTVTRIIKKDNKVIGLIAENTSGEQIQIDAKAVIIATGGFIDNVEWLKKYFGLEWGKDCFSYRIPGLSGDGLRMAWEVGARKTEMNMLMIFTIPTSIPIPFPIEFSLHQPSNIMVNLLGERFIDETVDAMQASRKIKKQKDGCAFIIFDEISKNLFVEEGWDWLPGDMPFTRATGFDEELEKAIGRGLDSVIIAYSLEELSQKTGIDYQGLKETLEKYNNDCENNIDTFLYKNPTFLRPIKKPRFYCVKVFPGGFGTYGGIDINVKAEVLNKNHKKIPGLYASGQDACNIYGDIYVIALPGNTLGWAINSGRIAGENAADYCKSI